MEGIVSWEASYLVFLGTTASYYQLESPDTKPWFTSDDLHVDRNTSTADGDNQADEVVAFGREVCLFEFVPIRSRYLKKRSVTNSRLLEQEVTGGIRTVNPDAIHLTTVRTT